MSPSFILSGYVYSCSTGVDTKGELEQWINVRDSGYGVRKIPT